MKKVLSAMLALAMVACVSNAGERKDVEPADLAGGHFVLLIVNGDAFVSERQPFMDIDANLEISGAVCNRYRGKGRLEDGVLTMEQGISTRMMCINEGLSEVENALLRMLNDGAKVALVGDVLTLRSGDAWMVFKRESEQPEAGTGVSATDLVGKEFVLSEMNGGKFESERLPRIEFAANPEAADKLLVSGQICNSFRGPGEFRGGKLFVPNAAATMMLCPDTGLNELEGAFFQMLHDGADIVMRDDGLTLSGGNLTLLFVRKQ